MGRSSFPRPISLMGMTLLIISTISSMVMAGCLAQQRAAEKLIDPQLRSQGEPLIAQVDGDRELVLGRYRVVDLRLEQEPFSVHPRVAEDSATSPLGPDEAGRTRPTIQTRLHLRLIGGASEWQAECVAQRRQPGDQDFAAAADENRDEVAFACQISTAEGPRWHVRASGKLGEVVDGRLVELLDEGEEGRSFALRLILGHALFNYVPRPLPTPLLELRRDEQAVAAMILAEPERVWLDEGLVVSEGEALLTTLAAVRMLSLDWEG